MRFLRLVNRAGTEQSLASKYSMIELQSHPGSHIEDIGVDRSRRRDVINVRQGIGITFSSILACGEAMLSEDLKLLMLVLLEDMSSCLKKRSLMKSSQL